MHFQRSEICARQNLDLIKSQKDVVQLIGVCEMVVVVVLVGVDML